jgi:hypothetical protein
VETGSGVTAIAGFVQESKVWIGGDSAGVALYSLTVRADQKVFKNGEFLFGFTSSFRMGQLLRYAFTPPAAKEGQDLYSYMVTDFINAVRDCLKNGGFAAKDKEEESAGEFLVGFRGRLFKIQSDYNVSESADGYDACGCAEDVVLGALFATRTWGAHEAPSRISVALAAAERHSGGVRGPFAIQSI